MRISDWSSDVCSSDLRLRLLSAAPAEVKASTDPLMQAAARLLPAALREEDADKQLAGELLRLRPSYMKGLIGYRESQGRAVYPDANSTLRVAFGNVIDLHPRDRSEEHTSELQSLMRISY